MGITTKSGRDITRTRSQERFKTEIISEEIIKHSGVEVQAPQYLSHMFAGEPGGGGVGWY